jgi:hypothetical protein
MSRNDTENESVKEDKVEEKNKNNVSDNSKDKKVYYTFLFFSTFSPGVILFCFYSRRVFLVQLFILFMLFLLSVDSRKKAQAHSKTRFIGNWNSKIKTFG